MALFFLIVPEIFGNYLMMLMLLIIIIRIIFRLNKIVKRSNRIQKLNMIFVYRPLSLTCLDSIIVIESDRLVMIFFFC